MQRRQIGTVKKALHVTGEATRTKDMSRRTGLHQEVVEEVEGSDLTTDIQLDMTHTTEKTGKHSLTTTVEERNR